MAVVVSNLSARVTDVSQVSKVVSRVVASVSPISGAEQLFAIQTFYPNGFPPPTNTITISNKRASVTSRNP